MTDAPAIADPAALEQLKRNRMAGLLSRANAGRPLSRIDRKELRAFLGGRLPWEVDETPPPAAIAEPAAPEPVGPSIAQSLNILTSSKTSVRVEDLDIWRVAQDRQRASRLFASKEWALVTSIAASCMMERPTEPVWQWAQENVYLDEIATSEPGFYDITRTPWAREWQELPLRSDVRQVFIKKPSRCGASEAALNIIRWMPSKWPGNAGLAFPDDKQARDVVDRRLMNSIKRICEAQRTGDKDDEGLSNINLINMAIRAAGSGSSRLFTEWWVRFWMLDELEEHADEDTTSTLKRALSRQADVADALLFAISKPKKSGGPIDAGYVTGTQKKYLVPCPRCGQRIEFQRHGFRYQHCRAADGQWDLDQVIADTWYQCQHCEGRIDEKEKRAMLQEGIWVPTAPEHRRHNAEGKYVQPMPGIESYQISDYYALHNEVRWGKLMALYLAAFEINPTIDDQTHYINNHEGECEETQDITLDTDTIAALKAGRVESRSITLPDGTKQDQHETLGIPGGYRLCYINGKHNARLPFRPAIIVAFADKQQDCIKATVWAISVVPKVEAHLIDIVQMEDEDQIYRDLFTRLYWIKGDNLTPMRISGGFMDSRYRGQAVYRLCLKAHTEMAMQFWPVRGEGRKPVKSQRGRRASTVLHSTQTNGKLMRFIEDSCESGKLIVRYFKDYALQTEMAVNKIQRRAGWRIWLPTDYPESFAAELTAEFYDKKLDAWIHNQAKYGPNDYRDTMKLLVLWMIENLPALITEFGGDESQLAELPPLDTDGDEEKGGGRDYILKE